MFNDFQNFNFQKSYNKFWVTNKEYSIVLLKMSPKRLLPNNK